MDIRGQIRNFINSLRNDKSTAKRNQHHGHDLAKTARDSASIWSGPGTTSEVHDHVSEGASEYAKSFKND